MRTKHRLSTPEIEDLVSEEQNEPDFLFPPGDLRNDDAYGEEGEEEDIYWDAGMQDDGDLQFWLGVNDEEMPIDQWAQDEVEMRQLIGEEDLFGSSGAFDNGSMLQ